MSVPLPPSVTVASPIARPGVGSSSVIVTIAWLSAIAALLAPDRLNANVSFASSSASPAVVTVTVCEVAPAVNVSLPLAAA